MTIEKITVLDTIDPADADGSLSVRLAKQTVEDGEVKESGWHRISFIPGCAVDNIIAANSAHLKEMGYSAISADDIATIKEEIAKVQTLEIIAVYTASQPSLTAF